MSSTPPVERGPAEQHLARGQRARHTPHLHGQEPLHSSLGQLSSRSFDWTGWTLSSTGCSPSPARVSPPATPPQPAVPSSTVASTDLVLLLLGLVLSGEPRLLGQDDLGGRGRGRRRLGLVVGCVCDKRESTEPPGQTHSIQHVYSCVL